MVLIDDQIHVPRDLETQTQLESGREMGWVTLGHFFPVGMSISRATLGICYQCYI